MDSAKQIHALLDYSLQVWKTSARIESLPPPAVALVYAPEGTIVRIESADPSERPVRWWVHWNAQQSKDGAQARFRSRPCTSTIGLLRTLRRTLNGDNGASMRIAPPPGQP